MANEEWTNGKIIDGPNELDVILSLFRELWVTLRIQGIGAIKVQFRRWEIPRFSTVREFSALVAILEQEKSHHLVWLEGDYDFNAREGYAWRDKDPHPQGSF